MPSISLLLAEDNPINLKVALCFLEKLGYPVDVANNGREVLAAYAKQPYEVILLDIQMPEIDGLEVARQIRKQTGQAKQPWLIAMTAHAMNSDRSACFAAGINDYLQKPTRLEDLKSALLRAERAVEVQTP
jgi:two-component system, sensor histidine kinase and response regulator